jgi:SAM-dependent methyltransferase
MDQTPHTWHYGLMARWWAEFIVAEPAELAYYQAAIERSGQPALDLGCGAGRLLLPLLAAGLDVDGVDLSPDMLAQAAELAAAQGLVPTLQAQALHELNLPRRYRTIFACGVVGLGATRAQDRLAFRRVFDQLLPGGTFVFSHELPYSAADQVRWQRWLPGQRADIPRAWPADGGRRATGDGDELETIDRLAAFDPLGQRMTFETRVRLWHDGTVVTQEEHRLAINLYFAQELVLMLEDAGFADVAIEGDYTGVPASADDGNVVYVARRAADRLTR